MISRIEHISIAVKDFDKATDFFQNILGAVPGVGAEDPSLKFYWRIFSLGDLSRLELIRETGKGSFLENFLKDKNAGGVHHITLQTSDIYKAKAVLDEKGIPYFGFSEHGDVWKELFIHPRDAFGILIQIAQLNPDDYIHESMKFSGPRRWAIRKTAKGCSLQVSHPGGGKVTLELSEGERKGLIEALGRVNSDK